MKPYLWRRDRLKQRERDLEASRGRAAALRKAIKANLRSIASLKYKNTTLERKLRNREKKVESYVREILMLKARIEGYQRSVLQMKSDIEQAEQKNRVIGISIGRAAASAVAP